MAEGLRLKGEGRNVGSLAFGVFRGARPARRRQGSGGFAPGFAMRSLAGALYLQAT